MNEAKPFCISKKEVWEAYKRVKENKGAAGVDEQSIEDFEKRLKKNLYKIWNRMSSGSYFPPPVRTVKIPKKNGGERKLGIPTVADRIAQQVVKARLEPEVEPLFHADSYGYRPGKSALDAVGQARKRCWRYGWVLDLDIKGFFDNLPQDLLLRAVKKHAPEQWIVLYIERWLKAPVQEEDGRLVPRERGTPQGGVISPLLANLFLHYALDRWLAAHYPQVPFERYADDVIAHCRTEKEAQEMRNAIAERLQTCGLELHPEKTKIVYCKDDFRKSKYPNEKFDFLGYTFQPRRSKNRKGKFFINFSPAVSNKAAKTIRDTFRSWNLPKRSDKAIEDLSRMFNPIIRGWLQYYGRYYRSALYPTMRELDRDLVLWAKRKYKKLRHHLRRATHWIARIFASRSAAVRSLADGSAAWLHDGSCMSREAHVQFCERLGVQLPGATHRNIYVGSERAGLRVMESVTRFITHRLKLKVNQAKSAVARPRQRKFLGFSFTSEREPRRRIAPKAIARCKEKIRELTRRTRGISLPQMVKEITTYLRGWLAYFGDCQTPSVLQSLETWLRRRLRSVVWKQWKRGRTRFRELRKRGVSKDLAAKTAGSPHGPWRLANSPALALALPNAYFAQLGLPPLVVRS